MPRTALAWETVLFPTVVIDELSSKVVAERVIFVVLVVVFSCILVVKDIALSVWEFDVLSILLVTLVVLVAASVMFPNVLSDTEADVVCCVTNMHSDDDELLPSQLLSAMSLILRNKETYVII